MKYSREELIKNFKMKGISAYYYETLVEAKSSILEIVPKDSTVGIGHSATLQKMNISQLLMERGNTVFDKELVKDKSESMCMKKKALTAEWYITGSNAVSADGHIVNIDHSGNRVAAMSFGPDKVIVVVGKNKVVDTLDEAIKRVKNIASPLNAKRAGYKPPCVELNRCIDCFSTERVCNILSIIQGQEDKERMKLFIVNEELGF